MATAHFSARSCSAAWFLLLGCQPALESQPSLVDEPRLLAVQAEPPEATPGSAVTLSALLAAPTGTLTGERLEWAFCNHGRAVAENNSVAPECLIAEGEWIAPIAGAPASQSVSTLLPDAGCALFGSQPPPPAPGELPSRPADPDSTGGYYQPVRVMLEAPQTAAFGQVRLRCALPAAPVDVARAYGERYVDNQNPVLVELSASEGVEVAARGEVTLQAAWSSASAEAYVIYDASSRALRDRVERLRVSWYASGGTFSAERSEPASGEVEASVTWRAPAAPGTAHVWAVLRDDRGGVSWQARDFVVH